MPDRAGDATAARRAAARARRVVVKVGSRALAAGRDTSDRLGAAVAAAHAAGRRIVVVSSGAIALGTRKLGLSSRPREMAWLQAAAAAGQSLLVRAWEESLGRHGVPVAQVLLTHADLADRTRANNARAAFEALLQAGAVPVVNENDTVAVEEIRFGDNDQLAAMVVPLVGAELLVLLSDVPGLLDAAGARVPLVRDIAREAAPLVRVSRSEVGSGGMASKVEAARRATLAGAAVVVSDAGAADPLGRVLAGADVGTLFLPSPRRLPARKHWIAFTLRARGAIVLDAGAAQAVADRGRSVLPVGVLGVRGDFRAGDMVRLLGPDGREVGRGLARMAVADVAAIAGRRAKDRDGSAGWKGTPVVVHRDDLVVGASEGGEREG